ncbi:hypothetical protein [Desulfonema magnum]|uniref:Uncharacterized protein n=1 Tax=Desulfonema magnum TaxID=45655 RepID=A0A975GLU3_9BACT|nr:hypothetical protein [Desulfonema magnum]QTA85168.1 Uncharacterized protein dnm_011730 [Desulfonema magnum]
MCSSYHKQYMTVGKYGFRKVVSVGFHLLCMAMDGLALALFRCQCSRKTSVRGAVRLIIAQKLYDA